MAGMLTTTDPNATTPPASAAQPDVNNWYQNTLGRTADPQGAAYWTNRLQAGGDPQSVYNEYIADANKNGENVTNMDMASASRPKAGTTTTTNPYGIQSTGYAPAQATAPAAVAAPTTSQGYTAAPIARTPGMLVQNQLSSILDPNSQLMTQAATYGNQESNARGLLNSSIGISAAQDSMIKAATPIAQQDAATETGVAEQNAGATNTASQFTSAAANTAANENAQLLTGVSQGNASNSMQTSLANAGAANAASQFNAGSANTASLTGAQLASQKLIAGIQANTTLATSKLSSDTQTALGQLNAATQTTIANLNNQHSALLQANTSAATMMNNYMATIANISASTTMDAAAKQAAVNTQLTNLQNGLQALQSISGLDLAQYFPNQPAASAPTTTPPPPPAAPATPSTPSTDNGGGG